MKAFQNIYIENFALLQNIYIKLGHFSFHAVHSLIWKYKELFKGYSRSSPTPTPLQEHCKCGSELLGKKTENINRFQNKIEILLVISISALQMQKEWILFYEGQVSICAWILLFWRSFSFYNYVKSHQCQDTIFSSFRFVHVFVWRKVFGLFWTPYRLCIDK